MNMLKALSGAFLLSAALSAQAFPEVEAVGWHALSTHFRTPTEPCGPNNQNFGGYVRWQGGWELGTYHNSHCANTIYAGRTFESRDFDILGLPVRFEAFAGLATGYKKPIAATIGASAPIMRFEDGTLRARLMFTRNPLGHAKGVLHLALEYRF